MAFWTSAESEPLRKFRFKIQFGTESNDIIWWAKSVTQPSPDISMSEYQLINHKIKYPGIVTWNDIDITIVDIGDKGKQFYDLLLTFGYNPPTDKQGATNNGKDGIVKEQFAQQVFNIQKFDSMGKKIEEWDLINPFIKAVKYGDLDYSSDELLEVTLTVAYDSATLT
jgi:hypothetical protein